MPQGSMDVINVNSKKRGCEQFHAKDTRTHVFFCLSKQDAEVKQTLKYTK